MSLGPSADGREETGTFGERTTAQSQARAPDSARRPHQTPDPPQPGPALGRWDWEPLRVGGQLVGRWSPEEAGPSLRLCAPAPPACPRFPACPDSGLTAAEGRPAEFCRPSRHHTPPPPAVLALRVSPGAWVLVLLGSPDQASLTTLAMRARYNRHTSCTCVCSGQSQRSVLFENRNLETALVPHEGSRPLLQP